MAEAWLEGTLTTIAASAGIGVFVDFCLGQAGGRRVREWMETWWLRISYVHPSNFGIEEAKFALQILDMLFGSRLFSRRRFVSVTICAAIAVTIGLIAGFARALQLGHGVMAPSWESLGDFLFPAAMLAISISVLRFMCSLATTWLVYNKWLNLILLLFIIVLQYTIICLTFTDQPIIGGAIVGEFMHSVLGLDASGRLSDILQEIDEIRAHTWTLSPWVSRLRLSFQIEILSLAYESGFDFISSGKAILPNLVISRDLISTVPAYGRILIAAVFVVSYIISPVVRVIQLVLYRIIESSTPVFTLTFAGIAALAKIIGVVLKWM